ncbi:RmlC-like cupin domain-containing protein [Rhexocercosporidium sp. MPI-PUGE-AT-0058]|nr:RmlC-like cupin domain-containing protein [Rhexocercosporidium sp. MPI-PUGE-AT-0058]
MTTSKMERLTTPPSTTTPYTLPSYSGELWTIPTSNSVMRLLVTGKETANTFAVVSTGGTYDKPIGFHYHREAHDVFLCLKGTMNVWADDQARVLGEGDFASVPPNTIHQYQITSSHTEFIGLIIPGGWEEFFRFIGEPYSGPLFPTTDKRNPFEVLVPKLIAATEKFDMIPSRETPHYDPQPWSATDSSLPGHCSRGGYFLRANTGTKYLVPSTGSVLRPLATRRETDSKFSIYEVHASSLHAKSSSSSSSSSSGSSKSGTGTATGTGTAFPALKFATTHHALYIIDGTFALLVDGKSTLATGGETVFIPAGAAWRFGAESRYARCYVFANGGGVGEVMTGSGRVFGEPGVVVMPEEVVPSGEGEEAERVRGLEGELGFVVV